MTDRFYGLGRNGEPYAVTMDQWAGMTRSQDDWRVARDIVGPYDVSTVFLGLDHNFGLTGAPVLWETCVFGPPEGSVVPGMTERYTSRADAELGHARMIARCREETSE